MENSNPLTPDPELSKLLQSWRIEASEDPALASKVWRRIETSQPSGVRARARRIEQLVMIFTRPLVAVSTVAVFTAAGAALAFVQHSRQSEARFDRLVSEYVRSIDPVLQASNLPDGGSHAHP